MHRAVSCPPRSLGSSAQLWLSARIGSVDSRRSRGLQEKRKGRERSREESVAAAASSVASLYEPGTSPKGVTFLPWRHVGGISRKPLVDFIYKHQIQEPYRKQR